MHEEGFGVTQDLSTAEELYMNATEQACLEGWLSLGFLCVKVAPLAMYFACVAEIATSPGLVSKLWKLNYTQQINLKYRGSIVPVFRVYLYTHAVVVNRRGLTLEAQRLAYVSSKYLRGMRARQPGLCAAGTSSSNASRSHNGCQTSFDPSSG